MTKIKEISLVLIAKNDFFLFFSVVLFTAGPDFIKMDLDLSLDPD